MNTGKAIGAGIAGAIAMSILMAVARFMGMNVNLEMMLGTMLLGPGTAAWIIGFGMHLAMGAIFGLIYAAIFENVTHRAGAGTGMLVSIGHILVAGLAMAVIPVIHPMMPPMDAPGLFMSGMGAAGIGLFIVEHLLFGAIVGAMYAPVTGRYGRAPAYAANANRPESTAARASSSAVKETGSPDIYTDPGTEAPPLAHSDAGERAVPESNFAEPASTGPVSDRREKFETPKVRNLAGNRTETGEPTGDAGISPDDGRRQPDRTASSFGDGTGDGAQTEPAGSDRLRSDR
jgi:hypothetical protein